MPASVPLRGRSFDGVQSRREASQPISSSAAAADSGLWRTVTELMWRRSGRRCAGSKVAALLLIGWLASRLDWTPSKLLPRNGTLAGKAHGRRQDVDLCLQPDPRQSVRGLAGLTLETASGRHLELDRGPGGLRARYRNRKGDQREWTVLGASRGEAGILGEGIRQALLRDSTYGPALAAANALAP